MTITISSALTGPLVLGTAGNSAYTILASGTILSGGDGVTASNASAWALGNSGLISAAAAGVALGAGMLVNAGTVEGATGFLGTGGAIDDTGLIAGATAGIDLTGGGATILAAGRVAGATGLSGYGTAIVLGTVTGTGGTAVALASGHASYLLLRPGAALAGTVAGGGASTLVFGAGLVPGTFSGLGGQYNGFATISVAPGASWTAAGANTLAAGLLTLAGTLAITGTLTDSASIALGSDGLAVAGGTFANAGEVRGNSGVLAYGAAPQVTNSGTLAGGTYGVYAKAGGVTNLAGGLVTGATDGVHLAAATLLNEGSIAARDGVYLTGGTATNAAGGHISASVIGIAGTGTVVNAGTITGANAVSFASGVAERLVVAPGAAFAGRVDGGNTLGGGALSVLEFAAGGPGTFSGLGASYVDFASVTIDTGATWTASGAENLAAGVTLTDSGSLLLAAPVAGAGTIALAGSGLTLTAASGAARLATIAGLPGNALALAGFVATGHTLSGNALTLTSGGGDVTLALAGSYTDAQLAISASGGNTYVTACFAAGTRIGTAQGAARVEALSVGDRVQTLAGRLAPIVWIGHRHVDLARHPAPREAMPIRVAAGALAPGVPARDLFLSPDHALFLDGVLVPVRHLVNDTTIVQVARRSVTYWHVELDRHDVILAEGAACESYLDTGNRAAFEGHSAPPADTLTALSIWRRRACAPLAVAGRPLDAILHRLHARETACGWVATDDPDPVLRLGGTTLRPRHEAGRLVFELPGDAAAALLCSRLARRPSGEGRRLGLAVQGLWRDAERLDRGALGRGWHTPEAALRWTDGEAVVPVAGAGRLALTLWRGARYARRA